MRVALFTDNDFAKINGVTTTLRAVLRFAGDDIQPRIYTASDVGSDEPAYFATSSFGVGLPRYRDMRVYWPRLAALARELRRHPVDVIHTTTPGPIGLAARWLAARLGLPLVGSYHTEFGAYGRVLSGSTVIGWTIERWVRWYYRPCDPLLVPSSPIREALVERGYPAARLRQWDRGVDADQFTPTRASTAFRRAWGVDDRRPAILYAGRLSREKGLALVAPVAQYLREHALPHRFIFAGDGPMRRELETLCPEGRFLGSLPHDQIGMVMASADILFFPSATDTLGNVVLEGQAAGLPVVVSDRGGPQAHVARGQTGFVCQAGSAPAFADALAALLNRPAVRREMGRQARAYALTRDWPQALGPLLDAWRTAARRRAFDARALSDGAPSSVLPQETTR
jgi:glycosyltransferase involved in cell wall biosynthesis